MIRSFHVLILMFVCCHLDPFHTIDERGVGMLIQNANHLIRDANRIMCIGVESTGKLSSDYKSVEFYERLGVNYLTCNVEYLSSAKIAAAQACLTVSPALTTNISGKVTSPRNRSLSSDNQHSHSNDLFF